MASLLSRLGRQRVVPAVVGLSLGPAVVLHLRHRHSGSSSSSLSSQPVVVRFSALPDPSSSTESRVISQASAGSLAGFGTGLIVAYFSRLLVIAASIVAIIVYTASMYGVPVRRLVPSGMLGSAQKGTGGLLRRYEHNKPFVLAFGVAFSLAAFAHF